nr:hypothetical protein [Tanacetum cinerariifolium]
VKGKQEKDKIGQKREAGYPSQLPSPNHTIHEMQVGKIGVYTRFFEYANFRLPLSTFLVDILRHYRINISQLSVIPAAKVSHFEILCRVHNIELTVGLFRCFYVNSKNKGWMSFSKRIDSDFNFFKDPFPKSTEFDTDHYAVLVAHPAQFQKFSEPFLCLVGMSRYYTLDEETYPRFLHDDGTEMDLLAFIHVADPTKVDSAAGGGHDAEIEFVTAAEDTATGSVAAESHTRPRKKRSADASGSSHPPKKLRGDYETSSKVIICGKSPSALKELLASSILSAKAGVSVMPTLPIVTSSVSATPGRENGIPLDSVTGANLRTVILVIRFVISLDSSYHSSTNASGAEVDYVIRSVVPSSVTIEAVITASESISADTIKPDAASSSHPSGKSFPFDLGREFIDHLAPLVLFAHIRDMDYEELFMEFNIGTARQACLSMEVRMRTEYCLSERNRLESECGRHADLLKSKDEEVSAIEAAEKMHVDELNILKQKDMALEDERNYLNGKVTELDLIYGFC